MFPRALARAFVFLALVACSELPEPVVANRVEAPTSSTIELPLVAARWTVRGNENGAPFTFRYCCRGGGLAETSLALPQGRWLLGVTHTSSECMQSIHPVVVPATGERELLSDPPAWGALTISKVEVPAKLADAPLRLQLYIEGGLHCCGTTTIDKIELVPL